MQEKPPAKKVKEKEVEETSKKTPEIGKESSWSKDQQEKGYYYDDSFGYEVYDPDKDEDDDDDDDEDL